MSGGGDTRVTHINNKNINNKNNKTTTTIAREHKQKSSSDFVINKEVDKELLKLKQKYLPKDERTDEEFLRQCSHHLDNGDKQKYNLTRRLKGLETIISKGFFEIPAGYKTHKIIKSGFTPEEVALMATYNHFLGLIKIKPDFYTKIEDFMSAKDIKEAVNLLGKVKK